MSKYWVVSLTIFLLVIFGSLVLIVFTVRNRVDHEVYQERYERLIGSMELQYTPKNNNLNIIILHLKNPGLENKGTFKFSILSGGSIVVSQTFTGFNIGDPTDLRLQFDPMPDSAGKDLILRLDHRSSDPTFVSVGIDKNGDIAFSSYYRIESKSIGSINVLRNFFIHIGSDPLFFGSLIIVLLFIFWKWKKIP